jgi:hypothetical protein
VDHGPSLARGACESKRLSRRTFMCQGKRF